MSDDREPLDHSLDAMLAKIAAREVPEPAASTADSAPSVGEVVGEGELGRVGRYRLRRLLGVGGMGVVYEGWDEALGRRVALKLLARAQTPQALERFRREAALAARLDHPNVVVVYESGVHEGRAFIAMEYVEGRSLDQEVRDVLGPGADAEGEERERHRRVAVGQVDEAGLRRVCRLVAQAARALHAGHESVNEDGDARPVIHRDVKPANVMVDGRDQAKVLDYGLAKEVGVTLTVSREAVGTPLYMSPEQLFSAKHVTPASDIYGLGLTLYTCATLARPFEGDEAHRVFERVLHDDPISPRALNPAVSRELEAIVACATAKDPRARYPSAAAMAEDLEAYVEGRPVSARLPTWSRRQWQRLKRRPLALGVGVCVVLGVGSAVGVEVHQRGVAAELERRAAHREAKASLRKVGEALRGLEDARMLYRLAATRQHQDPGDPAWLEVFNEGLRLEQRAMSRVTPSHLGQSPALAMQRALTFAARNAPDLERQREALELKAAHAQREAERLERLVQLVATFAKDPRPLAEALWEDRPLGLSRYQGFRREVDRLRDWVRAGRRDLVQHGDHGSYNAPATVLGRVSEALREAKRMALRAAAAPERLEAELARIRGSRSLRVVLPGARQAEVRLRTARGRVVRAGRAGEVLTVAPGSYVAEVRQGSATLRVPVELADLGWADDGRPRVLRLPVEPVNAPEGMALHVDGDGWLWVDRVEVTQADYRRFVEAVEAGTVEFPAEVARAFPAGKDVRPASWTHPDAPVTGIDHYDALAYAAWRGRRLPTAEEFARLVAAAGPSGNLRGLDDGHVWVARARSSERVVHVVGNVAEWLACPEPSWPYREAGGGSWARDSAEPVRYAPTARGGDVGVRCVRSVEEASVQLEGVREVPGGPVVLGGKRSRAVQSSRFHVAAAPVQWAEFAEFVEATGAAVPVGREGAARVTWEEARAYCAWVGGTLPSEAQWRAAEQAWGRAALGLEREWVLDSFHEDFWRWAPERDPINTFTPQRGHVVVAPEPSRQRSRAAGSEGERFVFRVVYEGGA